jgi:hypothetical protein
VTYTFISRCFLCCHLKTPSIALSSLMSGAAASPFPRQLYVTQIVGVDNVLE